MAFLLGAFFGVLLVAVPALLAALATRRGGSSEGNAVVRSTTARRPRHPTARRPQPGPRAHRPRSLIVRERALEAARRRRGRG